MLDSFPGRGPNDPDDPEGYEAALAAALCLHPREVAEDCADARVGVVHECLSRSGLTAGRINDWCRRHSADLREFIEREDEREEERRKAAKAVQEAEQRRLERDGFLHPTMEELRAKHGRNWGLKGIDAVDIARGRFDPAETEEDKRRRAEELQREAFEAQSACILADYAAQGLEPVTVSGIPISRELAGMLGRPPREAMPPDAATEGGASGGAQELP